MSGLFRNDPATREGKYPVLLRRDGTVPEWEWFVLGARDPAAPFALDAYATHAHALGMDPAYVRDLRDLAVQWRGAQDAERCARTQGVALGPPSNPDGGRHRPDNAFVLAFPESLDRFVAQLHAALREEFEEQILGVLIGFQARSLTMGRMRTALREMLDRVLPAAKTPLPPLPRGASAVNADLIRLIRQAEWMGGDETTGRCAWGCEGSEATGHTSTCPVVPVLYPETLHPSPPPRGSSA